MAIIERGALTVSWDRVVPGREGKALASFAKALQFNETLEKEGRIDGSRVFFSVTGSAPIAAPSLPTKVVQLPAPNVVQFAPLLPYSGKIPEVAVTTTDVPSPVQAGDAGRSTLALPGTQPAGGTPVNAVKYAATAAFLVVAALHITRLARKLTASL